MLRKMHEDQSEKLQDRKALYRTQESVLQKQLNVLADKWLSPNNESGRLISDEDYLKKKEYLQGELEGVQEHLKDNNVEQRDWLDKLDETIQFMRDLKKRMKEGSAREIQEIVRTLDAQILLQEEFVDISIPAPFNFLKIMKREIEASEPQKVTEESPSELSERQFEKWYTR